MADPIKIIVKPNQSGIIFTGTTQATTASNIGVGEGVYKQKVVNNLELKSLSGGTNVTITDLGDTLLVESVGSGTWGSITGTLSNQTDLQGELDTINTNVGTNAGNIVTNTGNISTNTGNITGNTSAIVTLSGETINKLDSVVGGTNVTIDNTDPLNPIINLPSTTGVTDGVVSGGTLSGAAILSLERTLELPDVTVDLSALSGSTLAWGNITGTLSNQTDLQAELDSLNDGITGNTANILTNSGNISLNDTDIAQNVIDIQLVSGETTTNASAISGKLDSVVEGTEISVDNTDPLNPIINFTGTSGGGTWGSITGTLSDQTDLQGELDAKVDVSDYNSYTGATDTTLSGLRTDVDTVSGLTETNAADIQLVSGETTTNAGNISTNAGDIAQNAADIQLVSGETTTNAGNISTNVTDIGTNAADIVTLSGQTINKLDTVVEGTLVSVDNTDPLNPIINVTGGTVAWGEVTGTLSDQTDLQAELDDKADKNATALSKTSGYTVTEADNNKVIECDGTFDLTFPTGLTAGWQCLVNSIGTGTTTLVADGTLESTITPDLIDKFAGATVYQRASGIFTAFGGFGVSGGTTVDWGNIDGTLSNQLDLQAALDTLSGATDTNTAGVATNVSGLATISGQTDTNTADILTKADLDLTILSVTGTTSLVQGDDGKMIEVTATGATTLTMSSGVTTGWNVIINNVGGGVITIAAEGTLQSKDSLVTIANLFEAGTVYHRGSNVFSLFGGLT